MPLRDRHTPGATIGRYRLLEKLGEGGQAAVWRAQDTLLHVERALKVVPLGSAVATVRRGLTDEARCLAQVAHPRVLQIYDLGETHEYLFIVMEIAPGGEITRSRVRSLEAAVRVGVQVLAALDAAHSVGIVHRDVKPSNVLQFADGVVKLSDFGIAQLPVTEATGGTIGTPRFCAPEQLHCDHPVDLHADIYGVGATLYTLVAGRPPGMLWSARRDDAWDAVPKPLRSTLRRATELLPEARYPSARAMAAELLAAATLSDKMRGALWALFPSEPVVSGLPDLSGLRDVYRAGLSDRVAELMASADVLATSSADLPEWETHLGCVRRHAHQIRGSGATYGFPRLSVLAGAVEDAEPGAVLRRLAPLVDELTTVAGAWPTPGRHVLFVGADAGVPVPKRVRVSRAATAAEGVEAALSAWPGVVVASLSLPDGDAREMTRRLRSTPGGLAPAVLVVAPTLPEGARSELLASGADEVVEEGDEGVLAAIERLFTGHSEVRERRQLLTGLREARSAYLRDGRPFCTVMCVFEVDDDVPTARELLVDVLAARLPEGGYRARWSDDAILLGLTELGPAAAELLLNVAVDRVREVLPSFQLGVGVVGPSDGLLPDVILQVEHLARIGVRTGQVLVSDLTTPGRARVAVCDDDAAIRATVLHALEAADIVGIGFERGEELLEALPKIDALAVVLDVSLPGIDGFETLARLRKLPGKHADTPVVMLTGTSGPDRIERAFNLGADDWVTKPFSPAELLPRVRRLLRRVGT